MSVIAHIATAVPSYCYQQGMLLDFMQGIYGMQGDEAKKLAQLYHRSGIETRYSALPDYNGPTRILFPATSDMEPFPSLEERMQIFLKEASTLAQKAILPCLEKVEVNEITHLITVSCTGLSAPGLEIQLMQSLGLNSNVQRSSVNFMGCYAAVHALRQADYICKSETSAKVLLVCVELCTLHFQKEQDMDNVTANLLFGDGAAAALVCGDDWEGTGFLIRDFYSYLEVSGISDMAWNLSSKGFLMRLSGYIPQLIEKGFKKLVEDALHNLQLVPEDITHWAIHPGGRKILDLIYKEMEFKNGALEASYNVLKRYGNMSSPTILFVLKELWENKIRQNNATIFGAAFGPGLTMETFVLQNRAE